MLLSTRTRRGSRAGSALLMGTIISTIVAILVVAFLGSALRTERWSEQQSRERHLEYAAENAVALAFHSLWSDFQTDYVDRRRAHWDFKTFLDGVGLADQSAAANPAPVNLMDRVTLPEPEAGARAVGGIRIDSLEAWREDGPVSVRLHVRARATSGADLPIPLTLDRTIHKAFHIEGEPFEGLDYALLANNINCLMCHTQVDNARRFYNGDSSNFGTYERVKVGSLESFQLRESPESTIAGTLYLAGQALDEHGDPLTDWASIAFKSSEFDVHGELVQDTFGDLVATDLSPADASSPSPLENLYLEYNQDAEAQVDGFLPGEFPSPFPDDGGYDPVTGAPVAADAGNRVVDDSEFEAMTATATGSLSGGTIGVLAAGSTIANSAELATLQAGNTAALAGVTEGNVVLHGTIDNPIVLNGEIAIQGDLILSGYVVGEGALRVSGNVFIPSDIQYADATTTSGDREYGTASDGSANSLAIASGGNVSIGDIFRPEWGKGDPVTGDPDGSFSFIIDELANFNRLEWMKTQPDLPGATVSTKVGEETVEVQKWNWESYEVEETRSVYDIIDGYKVKTGTEVVTVTKWRRVGDPWTVEEVRGIYETSTPSHANPHYQGADYVPRYYAFSEDSRVPIFNKEGYFDPASETWISDDRAGDWDWDELTIANPDNSSDSILYPSGGPQPVVSALTATDGWLPDSVLQSLLSSSMAARDGSTLQIDATIYSNNSVFGLVPGRGAPGVNGQLLLNGSIVAADVGLLAPNGVQLNYDDRERDQLQITADTNVSVRRQYLIPNP